MRAITGALTLFLLSCGSRADEVVVYASVDEIYARRIFDAFTKETGIAVRPVFDTEEAKTLGLVHRLLAERARPQADVFWNGECSRTAHLKKEGVLEPYRPPTADGIGPEWRDPENAWTGFGARARVIVYNTKLVTDPPRAIADLADPKWKGKAAIANPVFGTTATHVAALAQTRGEAETLDFLKALRKNDIRVLGGNSHVLNRVARGDCHVGLTDSDDVWVGKDRGDPIEMIVPEPALLIPNSAALIKGAPRPDNARKFLDWLLRTETEDLLAKGPSRQMPLRKPLGVRCLQVDWGRLTGSERLLEAARETLGL